MRRGSARRSSLTPRFSEVCREAEEAATVLTVSVRASGERETAKAVGVFPGSLITLLKQGVNESGAVGASCGVGAAAVRVLRQGVNARAKPFWSFVIGHSLV